MLLGLTIRVGGGVGLGEGGNVTEQLHGTARGVAPDESLNVKISFWQGMLEIVTCCCPLGDKVPLAGLKLSPRVPIADQLIPLCEVVLSVNVTTQLQVAPPKQLVVSNPIGLIDQVGRGVGLGESVGGGGGTVGLIDGTVGLVGGAVGLGVGVSAGTISVTPTSVCPPFELIVSVAE